MSRTITLDNDGNDITCMKVFDALSHPCNACDNKDCPNRETYDDKPQNQYAFIEYIVEAAHTAGWQEAKGLIEIENENELASFLLNIYYKWDGGEKTMSFTQFSTNEILKRYGK